MQFGASSVTPSKPRHSQAAAARLTRDALPGLSFLAAWGAKSTQLTETDRCRYATTVRSTAGGTYAACDEAGTARARGAADSEAVCLAILAA